MIGSIFLLASLAGAPPLPTEGIEVALEYARIPDVEDSDDPFSHRGERILECLEAPPSGDWKLPELVGAQPVFAIAELGGASYLLVLDRAAADDPFYSRLRCDVNANRDLTDDPPIGETDGLGIPGFFQPDPVDLELVVEGVPRPFSFRASVLHEGIAAGEELEAIDFEDLAFALSGNCGYSGSFQVGGQTYRVLIAEEEINGRFDDVFSFLPGVEQRPHRAFEATGDLLFLTDEEELDEYDVSILGTGLSLAGELFAIEFDAKRCVLTLTPSPAETASVKLPPGVERLFLSNENASEYLVFHRPGREPRIPPGKYRLAGYQVHREDPQGDLWFLSAEATPRSPILPVVAGESVEFPMGEPYVPEAIVPPEVYESFARSRQERIEIEFSISGSGNEIVNELRHVSGDRTEIELDVTGEHPTEPLYRIVTTKGKVVSQGLFEYG